MKLFCLLSSVFCLLWTGCVSSPERPENTNVEITRPAVEAKILASTDIMVRSGRVPLLALQNGQTRFGVMEPGTYHLTAVSPDPYRFSDFSSQNWVSPRFDLVVEKGKYYELEIVPAAGQGWEIRRASDEE